VPQPVRVHARHSRGTADSHDDPADGMAVQRATVVGHQSLMTADVLEVGRRPGGKQRDQVGVQRHVPVGAELAERDPQPVPGPDLHHRAGVQVRELPRAHAGAGEQLDDQPVTGIGAGPVVENLGSCSGFFGMSPAITGLRAGASGQSHSMIRSKNRRTVRIRSLRVPAPITWPADRRLQ